MSEYPSLTTRGPRSSLERVRDALGPRVRRSSGPGAQDLMALCPVHDEDNASLHVTWTDGHTGGRTMLHCFGCQAPVADIAAAIGLRVGDLYDEPLPDRERQRLLSGAGRGPDYRRAAARRGKRGPLPARLASPPVPGAEADHQWVETARYVYTDSGGAPVQEVLRLECSCPAENKRHKTFKQAYITGSGRRARKPQGFRPVLYRAPQVAAAVAEGREVWLVEGEKDVHTAEGLGLTATTNAAGAGQFPSELAQELAGARVAVVLDRDQAGWARGVALHAMLTEAGCEVRLLLPDIDADKADLTDHVAAGKQLTDLQQVHVAEVEVWHACSAVEAAARDLRRDIDEVHAHRELAEAGQDAEEHRRKAADWVLATQVKQEKLRAAAERVVALGVGVGTLWADQAMQRAEQLLSDGTDAARLCHDDVGEPVPQPLHPAAEAGPGEWLQRQPGTASADDPFRIVNGEIVQWEPARGQRGGDGDGKFKTLLSIAVRVVAREFHEVAGGEDEDEDYGALPGRDGRPERLEVQPAVPQELVAVVLQYAHPATGEQMQMRVPAEKWADHSWLVSLPKNTDYDQRRPALDQLRRAILAVSRDGYTDRVLHRATGWREDPDGGWRYIHAGGAITAAGHTRANTDFQGPIRRYDLPNPSRDPLALRAAWLEGSAAMLDRLPDRVVAPLLGAVFRAALGHNPWVVALIGPPGSYKTSVAAKAMQHYGERWQHLKAATSMSGNGDTFNALRYKLHNAKDALYWMDDFAPTKSWIEAQRHLEETTRLIHNREGRQRSARDGQSVSDGTAPRASGLCTSEVMPRPGSAGERMLVVPLAREDIDTARLFPLDELESRHRRALVMASYLSWLAGDLPGRRARYYSEADQYADLLIGQEGENVRQAAAIGSYWAGWVAVTDFLCETGAITLAEADQTLRRIDAALREAGRAAVNPDMPRTTGGRALELLRHALRSGLAHVLDVRNGDCPPWPLAAKLGWQRTSELDHLGQPGRTRQDRKGVLLGYVMHDAGPKETRGNTLMCHSTALEAVLKLASASQADKLELDRNTACRALHDENVLIADESEGRTRHTMKCRIIHSGTNERMVVLRLAAVLGDETDEDIPGDEGPGGAGTAPTAPAPTAPAPTAPAPTAPAPTAPAGGDPQPVDGAAAGGHTGTCGASAAAGADHPGAKGTTMTMLRSGRSAQSAGGYRAVAAVVDTDGMWLSNGEHLQWPGGRLPRHVGDLVRLAHWLRLGADGIKYRKDSGQIWLGDGLARQMGVDVDSILAAGTKEAADEAVRLACGPDSPIVAAAVQDEGYVVGSGGGMRAWTRVWRGDEDSVWIVLLPALRRDPDFPMLSGDPDPARIARRIGEFAGAMGGFPYRLSDVTTGMNLMTGLRWKDRDRFFPEKAEMCPPAENLGVAGEIDISWCRPPTREESGHEWLHMYDRSGSYLAGAAGLELGGGQPVHHPEGLPFDGKLPGYWRIQVPERGWDWRMPNPLDPATRCTGGVRWFTTPGIAFAQELGFEPVVLEAYTWSDHGRALDPWYDRLRKARTSLDTDDPDMQLLRDQVKQIYTRTIGMMGSEARWSQKRGYRPDMRHHVIAKARTNILRRIYTIGTESDRWPLAITTDSIVYSSPDPDPVAAWPGGANWLGRDLGRYKPEASIRLADHLSWLTGGPYSRPPGAGPYRNGRDAFLAEGVRHGRLP